MEVQIDNSLADWMIINLGEDSIEKYWSNKNELSPWDVSSGSGKKAWFICQNVDYHGDFETSISTFKNHGNGCPYCVSKKVHKKDSFAQWCEDNVGDNFLEEYWGAKNELSPWEISTGSSRTIWIKCKDKPYHGDYDTTPKGFTKRNFRCPYCSGNRTHPEDSFAQWGIDKYGEDFVENYWSSENIINPFDLALRSTKEVYIKCQKTNYHDEYKTTPDRFTAKGDRCPYCTNRLGKVHPYDSLGSLLPEVISIWSNMNSNSPFDYSPQSNKYAYWKCENNKHSDYQRKVSLSHKANFNCPKCVRESDESFLQKKVRLFLTDEMKLKVNHEHKCQIKCFNPKTNLPLPYDNEVIINEDIKLIVEVHGLQHYKITSWAVDNANKQGVTPEEVLTYQQWKDEFKKEFAISNGYHYLEIPYWTDNEDEEWKQLLHGKINNLI